MIKRWSTDDQPRSSTWNDQLFFFVFSNRRFKESSNNTLDCSGESVLLVLRIVLNLKPYKSKKNWIVMISASLSHSLISSVYLFVFDELMMMMMMERMSMDIYSSHHQSYTLICHRTFQRINEMVRLLTQSQ